MGSWYWWWGRSGPDASVWNEDLYFLILGQSNASGRGELTLPEAPDTRVRMFGNDYAWKLAYEPTDDPAGQIDTVSEDSSPAAKHSFALRMGKQICAEGLRRVNLIQASKGGTGFTDWTPDTDHEDRATLYGSANYRRLQAVPSEEPTAIIYYGHEDNYSTPASWATWIANTLSNWRTDIGATTPFIWCALGKHTGAATNSGFHDCAEELRLCETGSGDAAEQTALYMVTTFDLSLVDDIHLDKTAQKTVGDRVALAIREHVLGDSVDGTGPRLNGAPTAPAANQVKVDTTQTLASISNDADDQFRVFDDAVEMTISSVVRDPADASAVLITMSTSASGTVTVSYGDVEASGTGVTLENVVKNEAGLPLPQFGLQTVT